MNHSEITSFGTVLLFIIAAIVVAGGGLFTSWIIRPKRPNEEKNTAYESGEDPVGNAWGNFNIRFYIVALIFILFEVEIIFLFPWATVFGRKELINEVPGWGALAIIEMAVFMLILILGLAYVWRKGYLNWIIPKKKDYLFKGKVPSHMYDKINEKYTTKKQTIFKGKVPSHAQDKLEK